MKLTRHAFSLLCIAFAGTAWGAEVAAPAAPPAQCASLLQQRFVDSSIQSATLVPASGGAPAYCRVLGNIRPAIHVELRMPVSGWNGKFYMAGCGGFCGKLLTETASGPYLIDPVLARGYAVATTDTGHWGESSLDGRWSYNDPVALADFAYRAVRQATLLSKQLISAYYGRAIWKSYFAGCSNGGRQAMIEVQRFPEDYDGVIAGAPGIDFDALVRLWSWIVQSDTAPDGATVLDRQSAGVVGRAVAKACGGPEGVVKDFTACTFDPGTLLCSGSRGNSCLSAAQVDVVRKWWAGPPGPAGNPGRIGGVPPGAEASWGTALIGRDGYVKILPRELLRYTLSDPAPGPSYDILQFDPQKDMKDLQPAIHMISAVDPDLSRFKEHGGKLLMYHGVADVAIPPWISTRYVAAVQKQMGGRKSTEDFLRLFLIPGMNHCGVPGDASPGVDARGFDALTALEQWVEQGIAPGSLPLRKLDASNRLLWSRPACPYPQVAAYAGAGSRRDSSQWQCVEPAMKRAGGNARPR